MSAEDNTQTKLHGCAHNAERKTNWNLPSLARSNQSAITWVIARAITGVITPLITAAPEWADPGRSAGKLPRKQRGRSPRQHEAPFRRLRRGMAISLKKKKIEEDKKFKTSPKQLVSSCRPWIECDPRCVARCEPANNTQTKLAG
jgi:hypothetical protein